MQEFGRIISKVETHLGEIVAGSVQIERSADADGEHIVVSPRASSQYEPVNLATSLMCCAAATLFAANVAEILAMYPIVLVVLFTASVFALHRLNSVRHHQLPLRFGWWWLSLVLGRAYLATIPSFGAFAVMPLELVLLLPAYFRSLQGVSIKGLQSDGMDLAKAEISQIEITDGEFNDTDLEGAIVRNVLFVNCRFNRANLRHTTFENCEFRHCSFRRADLDFCKWRNCNLQGATLEWAAIKRGEFTKCDLRGADLENADLRMTSFGNSRLDGVRLVNAEFDHSTSWYVADPQGRGAILRPASNLHVPAYEESLSGP